MSVRYIETAEDLQGLCRELSAAEVIALDTEFLRERTYYPQLCLIQIATDDLIACVDPLALDDLGPLLEVLDDPNITKVLHAAKQDMEIFFHLRGRLPAPLFDTQIAASLLGGGEQVGYANLIRQELDVHLEKTQSRTDWTRRPLTDKQLHYAADDVRYLLPLYEKQRAALEARGRLDWLRPDFDALADPATYRPDPDNAWRKVKGLNRLKGVQLAVVQALAAWREQRAMDTDRPRKHILSDDAVIDIARLKPKTVADLGSLRGVHNALIQSQGETLIGLIGEALARPKDQWPSLPAKARLSAAEESVVDGLMAVLKIRAAEEDISAASLCSRKELERLVSGDRDIPVMGGWRFQHAGRHLEAFLNGDTRLVVENGRLVLQAAG